MKHIDYIYLKENGISNELCDDVLNEYASTDEWKVATVASNAVRDLRNCDNIAISQDEVKTNDIRIDLDDRIYESVWDCVVEYLKIHTTSICNITRDSGYELTRYKKDGYYGPHVDASGRRPRELSCSMILNDEYEGGQFAFFDRQVTLNLKKGDIIIFPSNFMYPHEVLPVTSGTRYALVTWIC